MWIGKLTAHNESPVPGLRHPIIGGAKLGAYDSKTKPPCFRNDLMKLF